MNLPIISKGMIQKEIGLLANRLNTLPNKPDVILCVLSGGLLFFSDLIKLLKFDFEVEFIKNLTLVNNVNLTDKRVLVIEDIFDTGKSVRKINIFLDSRFVKQRHFIALLKRDTFEVKENTDFIFELEKGFVYGYGLDDRYGKNRHLEHIYVEE